MLNVSTLQTSLLQVMKNTSATSLGSAQALASAYQTYAKTAQAGVSLPTFTGLESARFVSAMLPVMNPAAGSAPNFANALALAVMSFWLLPPAPFAGGSGTGTVILFPGQSALAQSLAAFLTNPLNSDLSAATYMAAALDLATKTVTVQLVLGPTTTNFPLS